MNFLALFTLFLMEVSILPVKVLAILNGTRIQTSEDVPYMCGIFRNVTTPDYNINIPCGCAIISPKYALTAAYCFDERSPDTPFRFFAGDTFFYAGHGREIFKERDVIIHPNFNISSRSPQATNLAIIKFDPPLKFTNLIKSIPLASGPFDCIYSKGRNSVITGWGYFNDFRDKMTHTRDYWNDYSFTDSFLLRGEVKAESQSRCKEEFRELGYDHEINICSSGPHGACIGDSGGPWAVRTNLDGINHLCGIIGHALLDCREKHTMYTRVSYFKQWICETTNNEADGCLKEEYCECQDKQSNTIYNVSD